MEEIIMTNFIKADRWIAKDEYKGEVEIRLISKETIMYEKLNKEEVEKLRNFLNNILSKYEEK